VDRVEPGAVYERDRLLGVVEGLRGVVLDRLDDITLEGGELGLARLLGVVDRRVNLT